MTSRIATILIAIFVFIIVISGILIVLRYNFQQNSFSHSEKDQVAGVVVKVGNLMKLPANETPTLVTVADVNKLKGESFFANAKNGFQVLIYAKAKEAILYDPFANKIIAISAINVGNTTSISATPQLTPRISPRD